MKALIIALLHLSLVFPALAESGAATVVGQLIRQGRLDEAAAETEKFLRKNPQDVDALMMKGNIVLNQYLEETAYQGLPASFQPNESIYESNAAQLGADRKPLVISPEAAREIAGWWKKCIELDSKRLDIFQGLAYVYSLALMKVELADILTRMKSNFASEDLLYSMANYARMFEQRNRHEQSLELYQLILSLYPNEAAIYSDMAGFYFSHGQLDLASEHARLSLLANHRDDLVYDNYFYIQFLLGKYADAISALENKSDHPEIGQLYAGLYQYWQGNSSWRKTLQTYLNSSQEPEGEELVKYLLSAENKDDYESFLVSLQKDNGLYNILLYKRAIENFPREKEAYFRLAEAMTFHKNYPEAFYFFDLVDTRQLAISDDERQFLNFYYGWALQDSGQIEKANQKWQTLTASSNFYIQSAACYFLGKNLLQSGKVNEASTILQKTAGRENESKYAAYNLALLQQLGKKAVPTQK